MTLRRIMDMDIDMVKERRSVEDEGAFGWVFKECCAICMQRGGRTRRTIQKTVRLRGHAAIIDPQVKIFMHGSNQFDVFLPLPSPSL